MLVSMTQDENTESGNDYPVLPPEELEKLPFGTPLRDVYIHVECPEPNEELEYRTTKVTSRPVVLTFAKDPSFYKETYCRFCDAMAPVEEFIWVDGKKLGV